jgi:hypothetical protein
MRTSSSTTSVGRSTVVVAGLTVVVGLIVEVAGPIVEVAGLNVVDGEGAETVSAVSWVVELPQAAATSEAVIVSSVVAMVVVFIGQPSWALIGLLVRIELTTSRLAWLA